MNEQQHKLRGQCIKVLFEKYAGHVENNFPKYTTKSMYECAEDWVSKGHVNTSGIVKYYEAYYT